MSSVTLYQRYADGGHRTLNRAGVLLAGSDGAFTAPAELKPQVGDYYRHADGVWWEVKAVGPLAEGTYPLTCERWNGGEK